MNSFLEREVQRMAQAKLYMIATPLGNLEDVTLRALERFRTLQVFFAEDSREFLKLLSALKIAAENKRVYSYASHNMKEATERALHVLETGQSIGFVSDRGTPAISDPGALLVEKVRAAGYMIEPIPGPSSVTAALSVAGVNDGRFFFQGFLPSTDKARGEIFSLIEKGGFPAVIFESPKRIRDTVSELKARFPRGALFAAREMTKMHESFFWHSFSVLDPQHYPELGEYVLVVLPGEAEISKDFLGEISLRLGTDKEWAKAVSAKYGMTPSEMYNALQKEKNKKM